MPKAIVCISSCGLGSTTGTASLSYHFASDYINPNAGVPLVIDDLKMDVTLGNSVVQINNSIKSNILTMLVSQGFPSTGIVTNDITIFGGAQ